MLTLTQRSILDQWEAAYEYWLSANRMVLLAMKLGNEIERLWWIEVANDRAELCDGWRYAAQFAGVNTRRGAA